MKPPYTLHFVLNRDKLKNGLHPIYGRIRMDGITAAFVTGKAVRPEDWDVEVNQVKKSHPEHAIINAHLEEFRLKVRCYYDIIMQDGYTASSVMLRDCLKPRSRKLLRTFTETADEFLKRARVRVGVQIKEDTYRRYVHAKDMFCDFIHQKTGQHDIALKNIRPAFLTEYYDHMRVNGYGNNGAVKHLQHLRTIFRVAQGEGYIHSDPFISLPYQLIPVDRGYLSEDELTRLSTTTMPTKRLEFIKDIFLFSCYTGMAFADIKNLKQESIIHNIDGSIWIIYHRQKTKIIAKIKLLKTAISILEKYSTDTSLVFPKIPDNGTCNNSLKQVAKEAKITKHLTYHMARHTFATTITLSNGVPIETVSKMLGHKNLHTTQIYARILDSKISADMDELERKLSMH